MPLVYHFTAHQPHFFCSHCCDNQISAGFVLLDAHVSCQLSVRNAKQMKGALTLRQIIALSFQTIAQGGEIESQPSDFPELRSQS